MPKDLVKVGAGTFAYALFIWLMYSFLLFAFQGAAGGLNGYISIATQNFFTWFLLYWILVTLLLLVLEGELFVATMATAFVIGFFPSLFGGDLIGGLLKGIAGSIVAGALTLLASATLLRGR